MKIALFIIFYAVLAYYEYRTSVKKEKGSCKSIAAVWVAALLYQLTVLPFYRTMNPMILINWTFGWVDHWLKF
ncbi:hypothetical protein [Gorillibacterium massiliense]|uniref:hypothetical protein n=1 Tax=Gorillibacterium massiliense TaxID=1280390 RepID=UPI0004B36419|nr:hypothetical protein [Gorillibacterium massiliense]